MRVNSQRGTRHDDDSMIGVSPWIQQIRSEIRRVARYDSGVLVTGPTGTGKELISRSIHRQSARADGPFVPVDCAALTGELFASQLFGHVKGAFTGAHFSTVGSFGAADGGTLFLDEIGELEPMLQAKLLRVIQEKTVVPLGSYKEKPVDVRLIAATNRDLEEEVSAGRFREDLFYRLNVVSLRTLPLRQRPEDIEVLARHILHKLAIEGGLPLKQLAASATNLLLAHDWPGNVRELSNALERAVVFSDEDVLRAESMPRLIEMVMGDARADEPSYAEERRPIYDRPEVDRMVTTPGLPPAPREAGPWPTMIDVMRRHLLLTLEHTFYNQSAAARLLGMDRNTLHRKLRAHGLVPSRRI
jgi:DNA-binding NtrC family response regulator